MSPTISTIVRIDITPADRRGMYRYSVAGLPAESQSRQPLLDACRALKRMGADTRQRAGLFRAGRSEPDLVCTIATGAALTVAENRTHGPRFRKFQELGSGVFAEAAE